MRTIDWSNTVKRDYRRALANPRHARDVEQRLEEVVTLLAADRALPESCRDHALVSNWKGYRECHVKPDLLLIYRKEGEDVLRLARLGSHAELFNL